MKRVAVWVLVLVLAFATGLAVAAKTYHPPDPMLERVPTQAPPTANP